MVECNQRLQRDQRGTNAVDRVHLCRPHPSSLIDTFSVEYEANVADMFTEDVLKYGSGGGMPWKVPADIGVPGPQWGPPVTTVHKCWS